MLAWFGRNEGGRCWWDTIPSRARFPSQSNSPCLYKQLSVTFSLLYFSPPLPTWSIAAEQPSSKFRLFESRQSWNGSPFHLIPPCVLDNEFSLSLRGQSAKCWAVLHLLHRVLTSEVMCARHLALCWHKVGVQNCLPTFYSQHHWPALQVGPFLQAPGCSSLWKAPSPSGSFSKRQQGCVQLRSGRGRGQKTKLVGQEMSWVRCKTCCFLDRLREHEDLLNERPPRWAST